MLGEQILLSARRASTEQCLPSARRASTEQFFQAYTITSKEAWKCTKLVSWCGPAARWEISHIIYPRRCKTHKKWEIPKKLLSVCSASARHALLDGCSASAWQNLLAEHARQCSLGLVVYIVASLDQSREIGTTDEWYTSTWNGRKTTESWSSWLLVRYLMGGFMLKSLKGCYLLTLCR